GRNMAQKSMARTAIKKVLQAEDKDSAQKALVTATSLLDRLARKGVIHRNTAARHKSRLTKRVNTLGV
ncbi:MAG: 30S ribosomal protein S20, partial [bacterium]